MTNEELGLSFDDDFGYDTYVPIKGYDYDFTKEMLLVKQASKPYQSSTNYLKGCKWSPDGSCLLTNSEDKVLRLFNLPGEFCQVPIQLPDVDNQPILEPVLEMKSNELIYDYCWYPKMTSLDPSSCFLLTTSRDNPIHLWDAYTGKIAATYTPYNHLDELVSAYSIAFNPEGSLIYAGFKKCLKVFRTDQPGRVYEDRPTYQDKSGQYGIVSCIAVNPRRQDIYAVGTYSKQIGLYEEPSGEPICILVGQRGGLTHLTFSPDGVKLFSGGRKDAEILCWDLRKLSTILFSMKRCVTTHQRIYFDVSLDGSLLVSGGDDGVVSAWNLNDTSNTVGGFLEPVKKLPVHRESVNGVCLHPVLPLLATSSGQRRWPVPVDSDDEEHHFKFNQDEYDNSVEIWLLPLKQVPEEEGPGQEGESNFQLDSIPRADQNVTESEDQIASGE